MIMNMGGSKLINRYVVSESKSRGIFAGILSYAEKEHIVLDKAVELLWMDYKPALRHLALYGPIGRIVITAPSLMLELHDVFRMVACSAKSRDIFEKGKPYVQLVTKNVPHCMHCGNAGILLH